MSKEFIEEAVKFNEKMFNYCKDKLEDVIKSDDWDAEAWKAWEVMAQATDNIKDFGQVQELFTHALKDDVEILEDKKLRLGAGREKTDFTEIFEYLFNNCDDKMECLEDVECVLSDHFDDLKCVNEKAYKKVIKKLNNLI